MSAADNLAPGNPGLLAYQVFVHDRLSATTEVVSVAGAGVLGNGSSQAGALSADGRYVAFMSDADNLVSGDTNGKGDIFVYDRQTRTTERVSLSSGPTPQQANSHSQFPSISGDGRFVAFESNASNLVAGDTNGTSDIFVYDRVAKAIERVSVSSAGAQLDVRSTNASISANGRFVAFQTETIDPLNPFQPGFKNIAVYDRWTDTLKTLSVNFPPVAPNGNSFAPRISADGLSVIFVSAASDLTVDADGDGLPDDTNGVQDVFVWRHQLPFTDVQRVSVSDTSAQANGASDWGSLSADGAHVAFLSFASNLVAGDTNGTSDAFAIGDRRFGDGSETLTLTAHRVGRIQVGDFAAAGGGDDRITGSQLGDAILGQAGNDILRGGWGNDTLSGGVGGDRIDGGVGIDTALFNDAIGDVNANLQLHKATTVGDGLDILIAIENLTGGAFNDTLTGGNGANVLQGGAGDDRLFGLLGNDTLIGGVGSNLLDGGLGFDTADYSKIATDLTVDLSNGWAVGGAVDDTLVGIEAVKLGAGDDLFIGTLAAESIAGNLGDDDLLGYEGNDTLLGGAGNDQLDGGTGADQLTGGLGNDTYFVDSIGDKVTEAADAGTDTVHASLNHVLSANVENLMLEDAALSGTGNALANEITGNELGNKLLGMADADTLSGGFGADTLTGGAGNDLFRYGWGDGRDVITDFAAGAGIADQIEFTNLFVDYAAVLSASRQVGADVVIAYDPDTQITLKNVLLGNLNANDFSLNNPI